ncbi:MAG: radical SAM family heme chaperone HemW [Thermodesulfobacteria bacterium]|nr:radical SAM family heme chaperone HemW [Thermodesulfobacteriota bacterium]
MKEKELALYIHIPFCKKKCPYCDFFSVPLKNAEIVEDYLKAIQQEVIFAKTLLNEFIEEKDFYFITIYIGGGTPSILPLSFFEKLFECLFKTLPIKPKEVTIEVNPDTFDAEKLKAYLNLGINRISVGVQSLCEKGLKELGRIHSVSQAVLSLEALKENCCNFSVDMIFGWKGQTLKDLEDEINTLLKYNPPHISFYELMIEEGTEFAQRYPKKNWISEEEVEKFYTLINDSLTSFGYEHYEISNYAFLKNKCIHNLFYWELKPYLGLGVSAVSRVGNVRWRNTRNLEKYINTLTEFSRPPLRIEEFLDNLQFAKEYIMMGLRLKDGISLERLRNYYNYEIHRDIVYLLAKQNYIIFEGNKILPTLKGWLLHNQVVKFLWDGLYPC